MNERAAAELLARAEAALADGADAAALRDLLAALLTRCREQQHLLDRLIRLADGYQRAERERGESYLARHLRELRRLERLVRISDRYQLMLQEANDRLAGMVHTDVMTGLPNRRFASSELGRRLCCGEAAPPVVLALVDIDRFKTVNDGFGHAAGDEAIRHVAAILAAGVGAEGLCARWGGEEFLLILDGTLSDDAGPALEKLRYRVETERLSFEGQPLALSISIGYTTAKPAETPDSLLRRADAALYRAKAGGRNQLCRAAGPD